MKKVGLVVHRSDFNDLTENLADLGMIQISRGDSGSFESGKDIETLLARLSKNISFLDKLLKDTPDELKITTRELVDLVQSFDSEKILSRIEDDRSRLERLKTQSNSYSQKIIDLKPYKNLAIPLSEINKGKHIALKLGFVPGTLIEKFSQSLESDDLVEYSTVSKDANGIYVLIIYHNSTEESLDNLLADCNFSQFHFGGFQDIPSLELEQLSNQLQEKKELIRDLSKKLESDAIELLPKLKALRGYYKLKLSESRLADIAEKTEETLFLNGWIKSSDMDNLRNSLENKYDAVLVDEIAEEESEIPPVALSNPPVIEAFEIITDLYGRPRRGMVDPTPFIAPFFPLFFGLCLTDAGYGLLISLIGGGLLLFGNLGKGAQKFMRFVLYSGIATIILGALAGGWFGIDLEASNSALANILLSVKIFDPLKDAILFFAVSIFLGTIQVSLGYVISGFIQYRESSNFVLRIRAILLAASWIAVTIGAGFFIANYLIPEQLETIVPVTTQFIKYGALGIVLFSIVLGIAGKRGVGASLSDGLAFDGLYGIVSLFGDLLSYARILALGLSTGVIAGVINIIAKQIMSMIPGLGIVIAGLLVLIGHVVYTAISALGAFVHPARLHFVEYFTKFYEAGGEPFEPFEKKIEGVELVD